MATFQSDLGKAVHLAQRTGTQIQRALGTIAVGVGVAGIASFIDKTIEAADRLNDLRTRTGLTGQQLLVLEGAAVRSGVGLESISDVASKLSKRITEASRGTGEMAGAMQAMGISVTKSGGGLKGINELLREAGEKFKTYEDGTEKAALGTALFGKGGDKLVPVAEAITETEARFKRLGITISEDLITDADKFKDTMQDITDVNQVLSRQIVSVLLPHLQQLAEAMLEAKTQGDGFKTVIDSIVGPLKVMASGVIAVYAVIGALVESLVGLQLTLLELAKGNLGRAFEEWAIAGEKASNRLAGAGGIIGKLFADAPERPATEPRGPRPRAPGIPDLAAIKAGEDALRKLQEVQSKISLSIITDAAKREAALLDAKYQDHLVGERDYWSRKLGIQKEAVDAELRVLAIQAERQQKLVDEAARKGTKTKEYYERVGNLDETLAKRNKLELDFQNATALTYSAAERAAKSYANEIEDLNIRLLELQGNSVAAAARRFTAQTADFREKAKVNADAGDPASIAALTTSKEEERLVGLQARFNAEREKLDEINARLQLGEERLQTAIQTGSVGEIASLNLRSAANRAAADQQEVVITNLKRIAEASGDKKLLLFADQATVAMEKLRTETDLLADKFNTVFRDNIASALDSLTDKTKTTTEKVKGFFDGLAKDITKIVNQSIATDFSKMLGLSGGAGSSPGGLLAGLLGGGSGGGGLDRYRPLPADVAGPVDTSGAGGFIGKLLSLLPSFDVGTDYVPRTGPAIVHQGERIVPAGENRGGNRDSPIIMNITTPDANSFRASRSQIANDMLTAAQRARRRNG